MKTRLINCILRLTTVTVLGIFVLTLPISCVLAQEETPIGPKWWPSEWGADDQRGAINRITPQKIVQAASLIKEGKIYQLGRVYERGMPLFGNRIFSLSIPGLPTGGPFGKNMLMYNDEMLTAEIGQVGTQFDGLGHIGTLVDGEVIFYNGFKLSEFGDAYGLKKLGMEHLGVYFTRGILLDVAGYKGVERLEPGYVITVDDIKGTLDKQKVDIQEGDAVLFRTGHGQLWKIDNQLFNSGEPGPGLTAIKWLITKKIAMIGSDTWATEAVPGEDPDRPFEGHQYLITRNGICNQENLNLEELAKDKVYEFAYIFAPLKIKGATGSPGNPIAVK